MKENQQPEQEPSPYIGKDGKPLLRVTNVVQLARLDPFYLSRWHAQKAVERFKRYARLFTDHNGDRSMDDVKRTAERESVSAGITEMRVAGRIGSLSHEYFHMIPQGVSPHNLPRIDGYDDEEHEQATIAAHSFNMFLQSSDVEILLSEKKMINEELGFGGTVDSLGVYRSKPNAPKMLTVLDWKTSNHFSDSYLVQVAAYAKLAEHCYGFEADQAVIVKLSKTEIDFKVKIYTKEQLEKGWIIFTRALELAKAMRDVGMYQEDDDDFKF